MSSKVSPAEKLILPPHTLSSFCTVTRKRVPGSNCGKSHELQPTTAPRMGAKSALEIESWTISSATRLRSVGPVRSCIDTCRFLHRRPTAAKREDAHLCRNIATILPVGHVQRGDVQPNPID